MSSTTTKHDTSPDKERKEPGPSMYRSVRWRIQLGTLLYEPNAPLQELNEEVLADQRKRYDDLLLGYKEEEKRQLESENNEGEEEDEEAEDEGATNGHKDEPESMDPLTQMVQQKEAQEKRLLMLDLKYRKERARRKRGIATAEEDMAPPISAVLSIVHKDLDRLQQDHHTYHHSRKNFQLDEPREFSESVEERVQRLTTLLSLYAYVHPQLNYRQGMHEILSYVMLVLEMDLFDMESNNKELQVLHPDYLMHDTFIAFEAVMSHLGKAYDTNSGDMRNMAVSILVKIRDVTNDTALYRLLQSLECPPELYCTRWVRLLFSREVIGCKNVLMMWDIFFDLLTVNSLVLSMPFTRYTRPGVTPMLQLGGCDMMDILETTAASLILLQRHYLLQSTEIEDAIHRLMNVPALKNILPLTATLLSMMRRSQLRNNPALAASDKPSLSKMAQNAISSSSESLRNSITSSSESIRALINTTSSTLRVEVDATTPTKRNSLVKRSHRLRSAVTVLHDYLEALEGHIPQSVTQAIEDIDQVRKELEAVNK